MESAATAQLRQEIECFEKNRFELLARAAGEYVLIKGAEIAGTFASESEAVGAGYRRYGNEAFLVKHIVEADLPLTFATFNLGA
jgi:hypothetical protein